MAFTIGSIVGRDGNGAVIEGGMLAADVTGDGPWFLFQGLVDGLAGLNKAQITPHSALKVARAAAADLITDTIDTAMTGTTSTLLLAAPGSSLFNYITQVTVSNGHATVGTDVVLQDGSGGATFYVIPAAANYGGSVIHLDPPLKQPTANTALYCANVTTGASTKVSVNGFKGA